MSTMGMAIWEMPLSFCQHDSQQKSEKTLVTRADQQVGVNLVRVPLVKSLYLVCLATADKMVGTFKLQSIDSAIDRSPLARQLACSINCYYHGQTGCPTVTQGNRCIGLEHNNLNYLHNKYNKFLSLLGLVLVVSLLICLLPITTVVSLHSLL